MNVLLTWPLLFFESSFSRFGHNVFRFSKLWVVGDDDNIFLCDGLPRVHIELYLVVLPRSWVGGSFDHVLVCM